MRKNYYEILQVQSTDSQEAIKKAYRKLSKENHPDMNNGSKEAEERFKLINEAYQVLSDLQKRSEYDAQMAASQARQKAQAPTASSHQHWASPLFQMAAVAMLVFVVALIIQQVNKQLNA